MKRLTGLLFYSITLYAAARVVAAADNIFTDRVAVCDTDAEYSCSLSLDSCTQDILQQNADANEKCNCLIEYYKCIRPARCLSQSYHKCKVALLEFNCPSSFICGTYCHTSTATQDNLVEIDFENHSLNFVRVRSCHKGLDTDVKNDVSVISMQKCANTEFHTCEYWIPPETTTTIVLDKTALKYLQIQLCLVTANNVQKCLSSENAVTELYGSSLYWPPKILIEKASAVYCDNGSSTDCEEGIECVQQEGDALVSIVPSVISPLTLLLVEL